MRFIHIADVHLGADPDVGNACQGKRSAELWKTFENVVALCEKEQTDLLLIAGDLFHRQPLLRELKEVNYFFSTLTHTKVVLIAGNHDYIGPNSYYRSFSWNENVYPLFGTELEVVTFPELDTAVYGFSYDRREIREQRYDRVQPAGKAGIEILLAHGGDEKHIPIRRAALERSGFDYIALGHIHKPQTVVSNRVLFAGALEPIDKNDVGPHGFIRGEIRGQSIRTEFVTFAKRQYIHLPLEMNEQMTLGEVRKHMGQLIQSYGTENFYQFTLTGFRSGELEIDPTQLQVEPQVLEVLDATKATYDFQKLWREHEDDLIGHFMELFQDVEPESVEEMALYEGIRALLEQED